MELGWEWLRGWRGFGSVPRPGVCEPTGTRPWADEQVNTQSSESCAGGRIDGGLGAPKIASEMNHGPGGVSWVSGSGIGIVIGGRRLSRATHTLHRGYTWRCIYMGSLRGKPGATVRSWTTRRWVFVHGHVPIYTYTPVTSPLPRPTHQIRLHGRTHLTTSGITSDPACHRDLK